MELHPITISLPWKAIKNTYIDSYFFFLFQQIEVGGGVTEIYVKFCLLLYTE